MTYFETLIRYHKCSYYFCDEHLPSDAPAHQKARWRVAPSFILPGLQLLADRTALLCPHHVHLIVSTPHDSATSRARRRARIRTKVDA